MSQGTSSTLQIFLIYLRLGCIAFGGPVAHLGYFKNAFVDQHKWLSEKTYSELLAICQFIPGPSSSQLGFAIGWQRSGLAGGIAAWLGFTLPSALIMIAAAYGIHAYSNSLQPLIQGLLIAAVSIVAKATWDLAHKLCPDWQRRILAAVTALALTIAPSSHFQIVAILFAATIGAYCLKTSPHTHPPQNTNPTTHSGVPYLALFFALLISSYAIDHTHPAALYAKHYQAGALVFGGGHVVLPLLTDSLTTTQLIDEPAILTGYSAAQAIPGPLFTLSAYLGTAAASHSNLAWLSGITALTATFLPGILLLLGVLPYWQRLRANPKLDAARLGANAAVVGLIAAALINPIIPHGIHSTSDTLIAILTLTALIRFQTPPVFIIVICGLSQLIF